MTLLGLTGEQPSGEIRLGFRTGLVRTFVLTMSGASGLGLVIAAFDLAKENPAVVLELLKQWGFIWILVLVSMYFAWDIGRALVRHLGKLSESVQESAVAMGRIADKDDRERDRMVTETAFIGQRLEKMSADMKEHRAEQRARDARMEGLLSSIYRQKVGKGTGDAVGRSSDEED